MSPSICATETRRSLKKYPLSTTRCSCRSSPGWNLKAASIAIPPIATSGACAWTRSLQRSRRLPFDDAAADAYGAIVASAGYSRRKLLDHMIAAQALVHRASLVTMNAGDYADVPGLSLLAW
ncbi:MAG TPA: PIN domain-containing protein [Reyranella sp.]|jgi:hypothetical protein|nr:PIN domain-containing protein [Reyranella sp.]